MNKLKTLAIVILSTIILCGGSVYVYDETQKIDNVAVDGITGVVGSLANKVAEIEDHFHTRERWLGISADQSGNDWALNTLNPFVAISGSGAYGADPNDEAKVLGTDDTPVITGKVAFDLHRILVLDVDHDTPYKLRIVYGTGTQAQAVEAKQYTEVMVLFDATNPQLSAGIPIEVRMPKIVADTKVWVDVWNATDNSEIDFFIGVHEYEG